MIRRSAKPPPAEPAAAPAPQPERPAAPSASGPLLVYRYSWKAMAGAITLAILGGIVLIAAGVLTGFWPVAAAVPLPLVVVVVRGLLLRAGESYRVYPDRLEMDRGLLSRRIDNLELFRVRDLGVKQGLMGRLFNYGQVYVHSTDASTPDLVLPAVDRPREFYEALRAHVTTSRAQRRTMIVEEDAGMLPGEP